MARKAISYDFIKVANIISAGADNYKNGFTAEGALRLFRSHEIRDGPRLKPRKRRSSTLYDPVLPVSINSSAGTFEILKWIRTMPYRFFFPLLAVLLTFSTALAATLPFAFDLRDIDGRSYIGPARDQGQCGSCWSFGALAAAESAWNRAQGVYDAEAIDLSEAFMVWSLSPLYGGLYGCDGASSMKDPMTSVLEYGVPREIDFPYTIADPGEDLHWDAPRYTMEDWHAIPVNDVETTRRVLQAIGAVTITVHSSRDAWYSYESGIFEDDLRAPTSDTVATLDHMISLVGWNDAPADGGMGYWIVRNSWGDQWGEDGYMRLRYTTSGSNLQNAYFIAEPWSGESIQVLNDDTLHAETEMLPFPG
jgi:hypothetical protein